MPELTTCRPDVLIDALIHAVLGHGPLAVAVSGGVDSMTLATLAHRESATPPLMVHAVSPATPPEATARVRRAAEREGWRLRAGDAGEFADPAYRANPIDRCFYCKTHLYGFIATLTGRRIAAGTNTDDLCDFRPGLQAAADHGVVHPYLEAGVDKAGVRAIARRLGLAGLAELPAAPCLASRIATGLRVTPQRLAFVHLVETRVRRALAAHTVRCRVFDDGVAIQLDAAALERVSEALRAELADLCAAHGYAAAPRFAPYRRGSAFLRAASS